MNVTFHEGVNGSLPSHQRIRQYVEHLKKFIVAAENPNASAAQANAGLTDIGLLLPRLKDQLLNSDQRNGGFPGEFASKQHNGLVYLIKVVVVLQGIVNLVNNNKSAKFSSLLNRKNSATNVRRKASVSEADCMECIKLVLEKAPHAWQLLFENPSNLEVVLYSINSPQLDSKCYSLEIILGLLDQPHGFEHLFRALTVIAARTGDYARLAIIVSQFKHGLHTSKLHIQILVARLMNKLMLRAPTTHHRLLTQSEAGLAHYSPEYVDKLLGTVNGVLGGRDVLSEELMLWRNLTAPNNNLSHGNHSSRSQDSARGSSLQRNYESSEDSQGGRHRRIRTTFKTAPAPAFVSKNSDRQRLRRHHEPQNYYEGSHTLNKTTDRPSDYERSNAFSPRRLGAHNKHYHDFEKLGRMRRVKSESAMGIEEVDEDHYDTSNRKLKRFGADDYEEYATPPPVHNPPPMLATKMSRSIHDLSTTHMVSPTLTDSIPRRSTGVHGKYYTGNMSGGLYSPEVATINRALRRTVSPAYSDASSQMDTNKLPGFPSSQLPPTHGGFSYLFPTLPMVDRVVGRSRTPDTYSENYLSPQPSFHLSPRSNNYDYQCVASPTPRAQMPPAPVSNGNNEAPSNVVYIPINMVEKQKGTLDDHNHKPLSSRVVHVQPANDTAPLSPASPGEPLLKRYDKRSQVENGKYVEQESVGTNRPGRTATFSNNLGEDVKDALREFDYLNDYDGASVRSGTITHNPTAIYHF